MASIEYCWRCRKDVAMLDESESREVGLYLQGAFEARKGLRGPPRMSREAQLAAASLEAAALAKYHELTGVAESDVNVLGHHVRGLYGPRCPGCGRVLRTPRARRCLECGRPAV